MVANQNAAPPRLPLLADPPVMMPLFRAPCAPAAVSGFATWVGPCCDTCGLPALLHGERCEEVA